MRRSPGQASLDRHSLDLVDGCAGLNLKHVHYFHAVASAGSIARAARRLCVSQSTISEQIKALEEFLDVPLFDRQKGGLKLNGAGNRVYEHSKVMFRAAQRLLQDLRPNRNERAWVLEVGVSPTISRSLAAHRLIPLFDLDQVLPSVRFGMYPNLLDQLLTGEIDLLISENEPGESLRSKVGVAALEESPLIMVTAPELAESVEFPAGLDALPLVTYTFASRYRWELDTWLFEHGLNPSVIGEADDVSLLALLAERGTCVAAVPEVAARAALREDRLVRLGSVGEVPSRVYAHYTQVDTPALVKRAVEALTSPRSSG